MAMQDGGYLKTLPQRYSCGIGISGSPFAAFGGARAGRKSGQRRINFR